MDTGEDWLSELSEMQEAQWPAETYQRRMVIRCQQAQGNRQDPRGSPWVALDGLRMLAEDKSYLHGFVNALQLPDKIVYALLCEYRGRWEQAELRSNKRNNAVNAGRRAANIWLQQGAAGFINWHRAD